MPRLDMSRYLTMLGALGDGNAGYVHTRPEPTTERPGPRGIAHTWTCEYCGSLHPTSRYECWNCGAPRKAKEEYTGATPPSIICDRSIQGHYSL